MVRQSAWSVTEICIVWLYYLGVSNHLTPSFLCSCFALPTPSSRLNSLPVRFPFALFSSRMLSLTMRRRVLVSYLRVFLSHHIPLRATQLRLHGEKMQLTLSPYSPCISCDSREIWSNNSAYSCCLRGVHSGLSGAWWVWSSTTSTIWETAL